MHDNVHAHKCLQGEIVKQQQHLPYVKPTEARRYGIGQAAWYRLLHSGEIKAIRVGRRFVVPRAAFLVWYNSAGGQIQGGKDNAE
jgi:excisionase family DNA binding protein